MSGVNIGKEIKSKIDTLKGIGINQNQIAFYLSVHPNTLSKWKKGRAAPNSHSYVEFINLFNVLTEKGVSHGKSN